MTGAYTKEHNQAVQHPKSHCKTCAVSQMLGVPRQCIVSSMGTAPLTSLQVQHSAAALTIKQLLVLGHRVCSLPPELAAQLAARRGLVHVQRKGVHILQRVNQPVRCSKCKPGMLQRAGCKVGSQPGRSLCGNACCHGLLEGHPKHIDPHQVLDAGNALASRPAAAAGQL